MPVLRASKALFLSRLTEIVNRCAFATAPAFEAFTREVGEAHDQAASASPRDDFEQTSQLTASRLTLMGDDDLELDIRIGEIGSRLRETAGRDLWRSQLRYMTLLSRPAMNEDSNPLGPEVICLGCEVSDLGIVPDDLDATRAALRGAAAGNDLIVTSGGVSVGEEDHVKPAVQAEGQLDLWLVAMKPGKPVAFGRVNDPAGGAGAAFIGLPGNPVSSFVTFIMLVRPFVLRAMGVADCLPREIPLTAGFDWPRPDRRREFLRARIGADGRVALFPNQGPGVLTSTVWADGLVSTPPGW